MRLLLSVAVVALAGVATASYAPAVSHTSHYGGGRGGGGVFIGGGHSGGGIIGGGHSGGGIIGGGHSGGGIIGGGHSGGGYIGGGGVIGGGHSGGGIIGGGHSEGGIIGGGHSGGGGIIGGGHSGGGYGGGNRRLFLSFLAPETRYYEYTWEEAAYQCASRGLVLVSIDSYDKDHYIADLLYRHNVRFIWTSGTKHGYSFRWVNGKTIGPYSYQNWSRTGGAGYPQPDNREGNEYCLAVLNNFYGDGIVWHDIACHHKKAFICEQPAYNYNH